MKKLVQYILPLLVLTSCVENVDLTSNADEIITIRNAGADIPAHIFGNTASKTFIVMVHGGPGGSGLEYRGTDMEPIEEKYAVVYTDQRGQGNSHGIYSNTELTIDQMVDDLKVLIETLNYRYGNDISVFMLGHSWGGTLSGKFVVNDSTQKMLSGWIEADGAHDLPLLNKSAVSMFLHYADREISRGNNVERWQGIRDTISLIDSNNVSNEESGTINSLAYTAEGLINEVYNGDSMARTYPSLSRLNPLTSLLSGNAANAGLNDEIEATALTNQLYKVTIPSLFLWGKYDFVVPPRLGYTAYANVSSTQKRLVIFNKSGHSPMVHEPEKFANEIIEFVEANR
ncbi:MAG: alpha/beta hydrolase [Bacteroidia bacterium]